MHSTAHLLAVDNECFHFCQEFKGSVKIEWLIRKLHEKLVVEG